MERRPGKVNLMLTSRCNQACPYCFAADEMGEDRRDQTMTYDEVTECLEFLKASECKAVSLLGGEPTLHPQFGRIIREARARSLRVIVFTNLLFRDAIEGLAMDDVEIVANINRLDSYTLAQLRKIKTNLDRYPKRLTPGFNIHSLEDSYRGVLGLYDAHGLERRNLRLGLASPIPSGTNSHVPLEDFPKIGNYLLRLAEACNEVGVDINYDCGFVRCMFTDEQIERLTEFDQAPAFNCGTPVDIGPGRRAWHCFPLSTYRGVRLSDFSSIQKLHDALDTMYNHYRAFGTRKDCPTCEHKLSGLCHGGCLGHVLGTLSNVPRDLKDV